MPNPEKSHISHQDPLALVSPDASYWTLFEKSPIPMWMLSLPHLNFIEVNQAAILHYGFSREEFLSMTVYDIRSNLEKNKLIEFVQNVSFFSPEKQIWKHIKKNGQEITVEITAHDILFQGKPARVISSYDITDSLIQEQKIQALNQLLLDSESKYRSVFDSAMHAIVLAEFNQTWQIVEANPAAMELFGYNWKEFQSLSRTDLLDATTKDFSEAIEEREKKGRINGENIGIKKNGERFYCEFSSVLFHDQSGKLWSSTMFSDISSRIDAQKREVKDKQLLQQAEELASIGSVEINVQNGTRIWSDGFYKLLGFEPRSIQPDMNVFLEQLHPEDFKHYLTWYNGIIKESIPESSIEIRVKRKDGMIRMFSVSSRAEFDDQGNMIKLFGVIQDVTSNKKNEQELIESKKEIEQDKALLESIINSPKDIFIVALDKNYNIIAFTKSYQQHLKELFAIDLNLGSNMVAISPKHLKNFAKQQFDRALSGEYFMMSGP